MTARRPRALAPLFALALLLGACTDDSDTPPRDDAVPAARANPGCPVATDEALAAWEGAGFSGTVVVTGPDGPTCEAAYGVADRNTGRANTVDTVFAIGSVSKPVTGSIVLGLVDEGALALDDRAGDHVPGLTGPAADVTVEQLLLHTSGIDGSAGEDHQPLDHAEAIARIGELELAFPPGTGELYSNAGYTLLALIVEAVTGTPWREAAVERALTDGDEVVGGFWDDSTEPAGPRAVGYLDDGSAGEDGSFAGPHWALAGNGDMAMTMPALAGWARRLFAGDVVTVEDAELAGWGVLDEEVLGEPVVAAAGGGGDVGHDVVVAWLPESERAIAIGSNTADVSAEDLLQAIGPALVAGDELPPPEGTDAAGATAEERAALAGTYVLDDAGSLVVADDDGDLVVTAEGEDAVRALFPLPDGVTAEDADAHALAVSDLLAGSTAAGREEREALEGDLGPIDEVRPAGTVVEDGELRSYVVIVAGDEEVPAWYALDDNAAIAAVEITDHLPTTTLDRLGPDTFRPHDPSGRQPDVTLTFAGDVLTLGGPDGPVTARRG